MSYTKCIISGGVVTGNELHKCLEQVIAIDQRSSVRRNAVIKRCINSNEVNAIIHKDGKKKIKKRERHGMLS